ncbi:hypothetical protein U1Q18_032031 [Sarracenia purpurea var. burkii]
MPRSTTQPLLGNSRSYLAISDFPLVRSNRARTRAAKFPGDLGKSVQRPAEILVGGYFFLQTVASPEVFYCSIRCSGSLNGAKGDSWCLVFSIAEESRKAQRRRRKDSGGEELQGLGRWFGKEKVPAEKSAHSTGEKTSVDWRNSGAGFSWSDRNKGQWICKSGKLLGRVHFGIILRGTDSRTVVFQYDEKKLQEILDPVLKAAETAGEEDDSGDFGAGCEGRRN